MAPGVLRIPLVLGLLLAPSGGYRVNPRPKRFAGVLEKLRSPNGLPRKEPPTGPAAATLDPVARPWRHWEEVNEWGMELEHLELDHGGFRVPEAGPVALEEAGADPAATPLVPKTWARVMLGLSAALYGTNFCAVKSLEESLPASVASTLRFFMATAAVGAVLLGSRCLGRRQGAAMAAVAAPRPAMEAGGEDRVLEGPAGPMPPGTAIQLAPIQEAMLFGLVIGVVNSFGYIAQAISLGMGAPSGKSALICSMAVLVVPVWDALVGHKASSQRQWLAVLSAAVGLCFLEIGSFFPPATVPALDVDLGFDLGDSLGVVAAALDTGTGMGMAEMIGMVQPLAFGMGFVLLEKGMRKYPGCAPEMTFSQLLGTALTSMIWMGMDFHFCLGFGSDCGVDGGLIHGITAHPQVGAALLWTGLMTTAFTMYLETLAMSAVAASEATLILTTEPVWALLWGAVLLGEGFGSGTEIIGATLVLAACLGAKTE